jgi:hypothetical protein
MEGHGNILETLGYDWRTLPELAQLARVPSVDVSAALQELRQSGLVEAQAGLWRCCAVRDSKDVVVVVDLGNVHDCLQKIAPLAEAGELQVRAYADLQYNGFGVNPPFESPGCTVFKAASPHKNAADTKIIWDVSQLCSVSPRPLRILVVTKDNGFRHLRELAEHAGHSLSFAQDWTTLRALLLPSAPTTTSPSSPPASVRP